MLGVRYVKGEVVKWGGHGSGLEVWVHLRARIRHRRVSMLGMLRGSRRWRRVLWGEAQGECPRRTDQYIETWGGRRYRRSSSADRPGSNQRERHASSIISVLVMKVVAPCKDTIVLRDLRRTADRQAQNITTTCSSWPRHGTPCHRPALEHRTSCP